MSENMDRLFAMLMDLQDYSVLPELAKEIARSSRFDLLFDLEKMFSTKIESITRSRESKKSRREAAIHNQYINTFYTSIFSGITLHYPVSITPGPKHDLTIPKVYRIGYSSYIPMEKRGGPMSGRRGDQIAFPLVFDDPFIFPTISDANQLKPLFYAARFSSDSFVIKNVFFIESTISSFFGAKAIIKFPGNLWDFHVPHEDFFRHLFKGEFRIKGFAHERFTQRSNPENNS